MSDTPRTDRTDAELHRMGVRQDWWRVPFGMAGSARDRRVRTTMAGSVVDRSEHSPMKPAHTSLTDAELQAIEARVSFYREAYHSDTLVYDGDGRCLHRDEHTILYDDIPSLLTEVRRLRQENAALLLAGQTFARQVSWSISRRGDGDTPAWP